MSTTIGFVYAPGGEGFRGKYDLSQDPKAKGSGGHSVFNHIPTTESAAVSCAERARATYRKARA